MSAQILILFLIIGASVALFLSEKFRPDLVAMLVMLSLGVTGVLSSTEVFSGLSNPSVILIITVFIVTGGLFHTGVSAWIGRWLIRLAGRREGRLTNLVIVAAAALSLFMNNIASAAVIMPAVIDATRQHKFSASKMLLPMAFATQLAGMATLFTTANIVTSGVLVSLGLPGFGVLDFLSVGGAAALVGLLFLMVAAPRLLPDRFTEADRQVAAAQRAPLAESYQLGERLQTVQVETNSPLVGQPLARAGLREQFGASVVAIQQPQRTQLAPAPHERLRPGDRLVLEARPLPEAGLTALGLTLLPNEPNTAQLTSGDVDLTEVLVNPRSVYVGHTLKQIQFRSKYALAVVALLQGDKIYRAAAADVPLRGGEALLVHGPTDKLNLLRREADWIVLSLNQDEVFRPAKMGRSLLIMLATLVAAVLGPWPVAVTFLVGAVAMVVAGCLTLDEAYEAVEWRSVFLVAGMLPVGVALAKTGAAELLGALLLRGLGGLGPLVAVAGLFLLTALLNQFIPGGSAVPAMLTPIAVSAAHGFGADPRAFALVIAVATGTSLLTPFAHPVNVLVMGPGGYTARDYVRLGLPILVLTLAAVVVAVHVFWHI